MAGIVSIRAFNADLADGAGRGGTRRLANLAGDLLDGAIGHEDPTPHSMKVGITELISAQREGSFGRFNHFVDVGGLGGI